LAHLAAEAVGLVVQRAPDDENLAMMKHAMCRIVLGFRS
jgi:hypothetical protein